MLNSIYRAVIRRNVSSVIRVYKPTHIKLCCVQPHHFSSTAAQKPISKSINQESFAVNYLINTFGFSPEKALSASKYLKFGSKEKPDLVLLFLKSQGFTEEQIGAMARCYPPIILSRPERTLLPKIEFFRSCGVSDAHLIKIFVGLPSVLAWSLEKKIMPSFKYVQSLFSSNGTSLGSRFAEILRCDLESVLLPNIKVLRDAGVPDRNIVAFLKCEPRAFRVHPEKLRKVVEEVKKMKFDPLKAKFVLAVRAFRGNSKLTWEKKVAVYKKWGWSENDIILVFQRNPYCMMASEDKITALMDFVVNKMGFDSSFVLKVPELVLHSLEKRVKPRSLVYKILLEKGLIKKGSLLQPTFRLPESRFLKRFVQHYEKEVPELLQLYLKALAVSKG